MEICVARQPIVDKGADVLAYELLFRRSSTDEQAGVIDAGAATASVLLGAFAEIGLEHVVGEHDAFINVPWELLVEDIPLPEPAHRIVVELLEDAPPTQEVVAAAERLKERGYRLALDDFVYTPEHDALLAVADVVKLDVLGLEEAELRRHVHELDAFNGTLLAEKVETYAQFERCRDLGFSAFQGFFLSTPRTLTGSTVPAATMGRLALLSVLRDPSADRDDIAAAIASDVGLSYKLLRYVNSAFFSLRRELSSVQDAVVLLGALGVSRWATLVLLAGLENCPHELLVTGLVRARMCELLAKHFGRAQSADAFYTTGLFSVIDAVLDVDMVSALAALPLQADINAALLDQTGSMGVALCASKAYERGEFGRIDPRVREHVGDVYLDAVRHADELMSAVEAA